MRPQEYKDVEKIGVDDWAQRKGVTYGSIIIDIQNRHPIDLWGIGKWRVSETGWPDMNS